MSTRFHDKWHGANHNSVSAIGIPDAGRDPIASYVFPFEGEFIMNNSPRNNNGDGHSEFSSGNIFDNWILSSNRIDTNIVRSQQDEPNADIVLSAKYHDGNRVVQSLHGTDNVYELEVSGADNYERFDCSYDDATSGYRHETHKKVGVSGDSSYTEDIDANVPKSVELLYEKAKGDANYRKVVRTVKDADGQYVELRVTDTNGHCSVPTETEPFESVDCAAIDGRNHVAVLDVGNMRAEVHTDGNATFAGYDDKTKETRRNSIVVNPNAEGGISIIHDSGATGPDNAYIDLRDTNITVKTADSGTLNATSMYSKEYVSQDKHSTTRHDSTTEVGTADGGGDCHETYHNDKYETVYKHFEKITDSSTIKAHNYHNTFVDGTLLSQSNGNSTYRSALSNIFAETPRGHGIYLNGKTSVFPHTLEQTEDAGTELMSDRIVISAYNHERPAYDFKHMPENDNIYFENMCGRIPYLNTDKFHCNYAWFDKFEATSGIVHFIDIVQSDVSGFDILGKRTSLDVSATMPTDSRLHLASASLWNDTWMYTGGDALFNRNVQINQTETVKHKVSDETSLEVGLRADETPGDRIGPGGKCVLLVHGNSCFEGNNDISGSETVVGNTTTMGNSSVFGEMDIGFHKAAGSPETTLKVKGDERVDGSVFVSSSISANRNIIANGNATIDGDVQIGGSTRIASDVAIAGNLDIDGYIHVNPAANVSANVVSANNAFIDWGRINKVTSRGEPFITIDSSVRFQQPASGTYFTASAVSAHEFATFGGTRFGTSLEYSGNGNCVQIGDGTSVLDSRDSIIVGTRDSKLKNAENCIAIGSVGMGTEVAQSNTIVIGSGSTEESNLLQFHNVPFFVFDEGLSSGKLKDTVYSFYDYENDVFNLPFTSSVTVTTQEVSATEAHLGKTTVHDGLRVIGSSGLFVEGNAYVTSAVSASEFYIVRKNGEGDIIEVVPLSTEIENAVENVVGQSRGVYSPDVYVENSENTGIVALAEQVDEAEHASYVFSAERVEHYCPAKADLVTSADAVSSAVLAKRALRVESAEKAESIASAAFVARTTSADSVWHANRVDRVDTIAHVDVFERGNIVHSACVVEWGESANEVVSAMMSKYVGSASNVDNSDSVDNCIEVYSANVVDESALVQSASSVKRTEFVESASGVKSADRVECVSEADSAKKITSAGLVQCAESVKKTNIVESATDVHRIKFFNGMELRGPAANRVVRCDKEIPVTEWADYYKTTNTNVVLSGEAIGWKDEDYDLSFTIRFVPDVETLYGIFISADRDIDWIGANGFTKKFKAPVSVKMRVSKDEITARLEA